MERGFTKPKRRVHTEIIDHIDYFQRPIGAAADLMGLPILMEAMLAENKKRPRLARKLPADTPGKHSPENDPVFPELDTVSLACPPFQAIVNVLASQLKTPNP